MQGNSQKKHSNIDAYRFGLFELIPSERELRKSGTRVALQPKAFDALLLFVRNAERLVRRDELVDTLWPDTYVTDTNLTNVIVTLRKVLGREAIQTVSKFGYRFCLPVVGEPGIATATYAIFIEAKGLAAGRSLESMARARDLFALCVAHDPAFAAAWAWLGRCARFLDKFATERSVNLELADATLSPPLPFTKGVPVLNSLLHLFGGALHFLLGYAALSSVSAHGVAIACYFGLVFTAGHLTHETRDHDGDLQSAIRTNAVAFGKKRAFGAGLLLFSAAYLLLTVLALRGVVPRVLSLAIVLYVIHLVASWKAWRAGLTYDAIRRLQATYRNIHALIGLAMLVVVPPWYLH